MINFDFDKIAPLCEAFRVKLTEEIRERLSVYGNLLVSWNEKINLTAITEPQDILFKHFYDCLLFFKAVDVPENAKIIDVGTGAGFPGLVLKIARPDIELTLLDGLNKRLVFLSEVLKSIDLKAELIHSRAEDAGKKPELRERFDIVTARAVAGLPVLCEYCIPFARCGGLFVAMKGEKAGEELSLAANAYKMLGCQKPSIICETLTGNEKRAFIISKKISQTPTKYPRHGNKISKDAIK